MAQELNVQDLKITSPAFDHHKSIPDKYTSNGENVSPPLEWSGAPDGTQSFALVCHDPDAPLVDGFTHWVAYGIDGTAEGLRESATELIQGTNSLGNQAYNGPAPPPGHGTHHYYFWLYALREDPELEAGLNRRELHEAVEDLVIEQARLVGTYKND
jgi:Raf kinase inhibitor-like YbhB/YbcL family protein